MTAERPRPQLAAPSLVVLTDTREQAVPPFPPGVEVQRATLAEADYTTPALFDVARIERKSPGDLASTLSHRRERFDREVQRLQPYRFKCVVVEGDLSEVYRVTRMHPHSILGSIASLLARWDVPVLFAASPSGAGRLMVGLLRRWQERCAEDGARR